MLVQRGLDEWFGTLVRYTGLGLVLYAAFVDKFHNPFLVPAAAGMMGLKTVLTRRKEP